ncbi:hypothetical protein GGR50DRAFT_190488 [Xylaria sp. CBS 124048]|nr:hypothetical protein GGR50DRAFT_190488 [Xylaria sp. CBS 124048]
MRKGADYVTKRLYHYRHILLIIRRRRRLCPQVLRRTKRSIGPAIHPSSPYTVTNNTRYLVHTYCATELPTMCLFAEPSRKYYYHEEYIPARRHPVLPGRLNTPYTSFASAPARVGHPHVIVGSPRRSGPIVYGRRTTKLSYV